MSRIRHAIEYRSRLLHLQRYADDAFRRRLVLAPFFAFVLTLRATSQPPRKTTCGRT